MHLACKNSAFHTATPLLRMMVTSSDLDSTAEEFWVCWVSSLRLKKTATTTKATKSKRQTTAMPITSGFTRLVSWALFNSVSLTSFRGSADDVFRAVSVSVGSDISRIILIFAPCPWSPICRLSPRSRRYKRCESLNERLFTSDKIWEVASFLSAVERPTDRAGLELTPDVTE